MKRYLFTLLITGAAMHAHAQKFMTRTGAVSFRSAAKMETIEAVNNEAACVVNLKTGEVVMQMMVRSFKFEKALMQEHFNENYMESHKYPKATFKGNIGDAGQRVQSGGIVKAIAEGELTMHGVSQSVKVPVTLSLRDDDLKATGSFKVRPKDYNIDIPKLVAGKIAEEIEVEVKTTMAAID